MKYGYAVNYWPDTTAIKSSYPANDQDVLNEGYVFVETTGDFTGLPVDDPRFYPDIEIPAKRDEMRKACQEQITLSTFTSGALGSDHDYDCRLVDQVNLQMRYTLAVTGEVDQPLYAYDGSSFEWLPHSADQILSVMSAMNDHIVQAQEKLAVKMAEIDLAVTRDDLSVIVW